LEEIQEKKGGKKGKTNPCKEKSEVRKRAEDLKGKKNDIKEKRTDFFKKKELQQQHGHRKKKKRSKQSKPGGKLTRYLLCQGEGGELWAFLLGEKTEKMGFRKA